MNNSSAGLFWSPRSWKFDIFALYPGYWFNDLRRSFQHLPRVFFQHGKGPVPFHDLVLHTNELAYWCETMKDMIPVCDSRA